MSGQVSGLPARVLVFGARGAIGTEICSSLRHQGVQVIGVSRTAPEAGNVASWLVWPDLEKPIPLDSLPSAGIDAVIWAQGVNANDGIRTFDADAHRAMYGANVLAILVTLRALLDQGRLAPSTRLVILSSIWQNIGRADKLSYMVTKSALAGLVRSLSLDLGPDGILVNAILPGPLDTPMTRAALSPAQIAQIEALTPTRRLPAVSDICALTEYLISAKNISTTGQFLTVDGGFSDAKIF